MRSKKSILTNFTRSSYSESFLLRPDTEDQLQDYLRQHQTTPILARGNGLSYNDSCFNSAGYVINTQRLNHFISFDTNSGMVECQGAVRFKDLFNLHPEFIPPVLPGTLYATIAGGIAHDVHGKNNPHFGSFGQQLSWFDLLIDGERIHCSQQVNSDLFKATIGGLGLTGIITRVGLCLKKDTKTVKVQRHRYHNLKDLLTEMISIGLKFDYQMAWLDLLHSPPRAILALANHSDNPSKPILNRFIMPKSPFCLLRPWNVKLFNHYIFKQSASEDILNLVQFNNPLDSIAYWNRCYGKKGLIQFQALFSENAADHVLNHLLNIIKTHNATPTLAVLKLFQQSGVGFLSFCKPGFTLAIDFIHSSAARSAIMAMNNYIAQIGGRVYLSKDMLLNSEQFTSMYDNIGQFKHILSKNTHMIESDLAKRIGLIK